MITPPGFRGVAFTTADEGDLRSDLASRAKVSELLDVPDSWATVGQVHGAMVRRAEEPGQRGDGDALFTASRRLPLAVFTADCLAVVLEAEGGVGIAHAGWRGAAAGVVRELRAAMASTGLEAQRAAVGPGIGPCCFEVGPEVIAHFAGHTATTSWGTPSIDLVGAVAKQLAGLEVWRADACTRCDESFFSHRRNGTELRLAGIGWLP